MHRALSIGAATLVFCFAAAAAGDRERMPRKAEMFSPAPVHSWAGFYLGGHVGGIGGAFNTNVAPLMTGPAGDGGGGIGGAQAGANWQVQQLVFGIEADTSAIELAATAGSASFEEDWLSTARGRIGYAWQRALLYLTAGVGFTSTEIASFARSVRNVQTGIAAGAGLELALPWPRLSGRVEYLYVDVPKDSAIVGPSRIEGGSENHIGRVALNYWLW
jgi:outer membrane immunogenic protein